MYKDIGRKRGEVKQNFFTVRYGCRLQWHCFPELDNIWWLNYLIIRLTFVLIRISSKLLRLRNSQQYYSLLLNYFKFNFIYLEGERERGREGERERGREGGKVRGRE